ncbi:8475_t:CDS:2 [Gigaspora margarita]|uniref:8475_t:CDS:1 n=1 Tax=Gigaspora margarita TaxID=4874 RepID=A0ABN7V4S4_GIGMA|nr:8475_t:CDS:2 [Gigaspora margarita]
MTWRRNQSASQIDDIWISTEVIHKFMKPELWQADGITDSDHVILKTSWKIKLRAKPRRKKKTIRKCYQYDKTSEEDWTEIRKFIGEKMAEETNYDDKLYMYFNENAKSNRLHEITTETEMEHPSEKEETNPFTRQIWQADKECWIYTANDK